MPNFVKNRSRGFVPYGQIFYQKFEIFAILSYLSPHFCTHNVEIWFKRTSLSSFVAGNSALRSAIRRHHPPQRAVLSQICCFWEHKVVLFQILLDSAEPRDAGTT